MKWIRQKMCPHYFIPEWNLFHYTMKESRRLDIFETLRIHTNIETLSEWFRTEYLSKVFVNTIHFSRLDYSKFQHVLDTIAASNRLNKDFRIVLKKWADEKYYLALLSTHGTALIFHYDTLHWNATPGMGPRPSGSRPRPRPRPELPRPRRDRDVCQTVRDETETRPSSVRDETETRPFTGRDYIETHDL